MAKGGIGTWVQSAYSLSGYLPSPPSMPSLPRVAAPQVSDKWPGVCQVLRRKWPPQHSLRSLIWIFHTLFAEIKTCFGLLHEWRSSVNASLSGLQGSQRGSWPSRISQEFCRSRCRPKCFLHEDQMDLLREMAQNTRRTSTKGWILKACFYLGLPWNHLKNDSTET